MSLFIVSYMQSENAYILEASWDSDQVYVFFSALEAKEFIDLFYRNPLAATAAYAMVNG